jgi:hypothetical protein
VPPDALIGHFPSISYVIFFAMAHGVFWHGTQFFIHEKQALLEETPDTSSGTLYRFMAQREC